ncbi:MAG TPA: hydrolase [Bryobacteraceae bacterium]|nr:hydrolase [Bryobacteraceae bacterium]
MSLEIEKQKTALVVIDLQKGVAQRQTAPYSPAQVIENAAALAAAFRAAGAPVFLVRVTPSPDRKDALHPKSDTSWPVSTPPPDWANLVPEMGPKPGDFVITKRQWGAFYGTELDLQLRRRGMTSIVLCGIATEIGVESTARDAYERGYEQVFARDAMAGITPESHHHTIERIFPRMGQVRSTAEILEAMK